MITEITRAHIRLTLGEKTVTVEGEGFAPGYGSPDFVVYKNSIERWDPPFDVEVIDDIAREQILLEIKQEMSKKGMTIEIE
jgi:hypothetical protein